MSLTSQLKQQIVKEIQSDDLTTFKQLNLFEIPVIDKTGATLLHYAAHFGNFNALYYLLSNYPTQINCTNNDNKTAVHEAVQSQHLNCVRLLVEKGANLNVLKKADWTPLMLACTKSSHVNSRHIVELLLLHGAVLNFQNKDGWSCLHLICREGNVEIFKLLLEHGLNLFMTTNNGRTALHVAALHGHLDLVKILLDLGLNPNQTDSCGNSALHESVLGGDFENFKFLLNRDADFSLRNKADFSILHLASSENYCNFIEFIVKNLKFDVNLRNCYGFMALHCAARKQRYEAFQCLLKLGAVDVKDNYGRFAKDYLSNS